MDSYAPCPCGSGKKVKFCCQAILPEMSKIERLQENNQPHMALQLIDKLLKDHPDNGWLVTQRAMALFNDEGFEAARDSLLPYLRQNPDHPLANALLAIAVSQIEPMERSKKVIHRAFLKSLNAEPQLVAILAGKLVSHFLEAGQDMAARQHMAMVMRLGNDDERQRSLMAMLELDSDTSVAYPLRGGHPLPSYDPPEDLRAQFKKAQRLYIHGCFSEAADLLQSLTESDPASAELWHTIGLMRAWDGDEVAGAAALHQAAALYGDYDRAVDLETVAQLLDRRQKDGAIVSRMAPYEAESLSKLLTRLDNADRLCRIPSMDQPGGIAASYDLLDRDLPTDDELEQLTVDTVPRSIARIVLMDADGAGASALAYLTAVEGERMEQAKAVFENAAGDLVKPAPKEDGEEDEVVAWFAKDEFALIESAFFPPKTPTKIRQQLRREFIEKSIHDTWMNAPQSSLDDKSPLEAAKDESLKVRLAAAIRVFDSFLDRRDIMLDQEEIASKLNVQLPTSIEPHDDLDLNTLTVSQLQRIRIDGMSDKLFDLVMQRALVIMHCGHGYRVLKEFLTNRPDLVEEKESEAQQGFRTMAEICNRSLREEEALQWIQCGFEHAKSKGAPFEAQLMWKMQELQYRAKDLEDPQLKDLLLELWNNYGGKLPIVRERLTEFVRALQIDAPWEHAIVMPGTGAGGADWTAETEQTVSGEKKLWLPD